MVIELQYVKPETPIGIKNINLPRYYKYKLNNKDLYDIIEPIIDGKHYLFGKTETITIKTKNSENKINKETYFYALKISDDKVLDTMDFLGLCGFRYLLVQDKHSAIAANSDKPGAKTYFFNIEYTAYISQIEN